MDGQAIFSRQQEQDKEKLIKMFGKRNYQIMSRRVAGETIREIAHTYGLSPARISKMTKRNFDKLEELSTPGKYHWTYQLSSRTTNCMRSARIETAEQATSALESGELRADGKYRGESVRNFGRRSFVELCDELGVTPPPVPAKYRRQTMEKSKDIICPVCHVKFRLDEGY
jgi:hypothetical protein